jgi:peptidoglycan hydrolase-like protein with peptidoglycan-binding domain
MRGRSWAIAAATALAAGVGVAIWYAGRPAPQAATPTVQTTTATVARGDVTERVQLSGTLAFDGSWTVVNQLPPGVLTAAPAPGTVIVRGADLFAVAGTPAVLLYGATPAYRDFQAGMSDGADVRQLEQNLVPLGFDPHHSVTVDRHFSAATATAIRRWQAARGVPAADRTGTIPLGQVVFLPGAMRVNEVPTAVGGILGPGAPALTGTSTARVVTAQVTTDQQRLVHVKDQVQVTFPGGGGVVSGRVTRIGRVASAAAASGGGQQQPAGPATIPVTIGVRPPSASAGLDQAPVQVAITTQRHQGVLLLPVTALLARPGGGYQVAVLDGDARRMVEVSPGLFDDSAATVEVSGSGLAEGDVVEVPSQ